jgi:hypothetical protein
MKSFEKTITKLFVVVFFIAVYIALLTTLTKPENSRKWTEDQKILAQINFATTTANANIVTINDIKNFTYPTQNENEKLAGYYSDTFKYDTLNNVWFFQNDFHEPLGAHTFLTFEFDDNGYPKYLSFSAEIRKEVGESYSPFRGLFNHYELHYMLVSEKDILTLRAGLREPEVFMYKLKLNRNEKINLFKDVLLRAEKVNRQPEFYNTYNNACTTNIVDHLNKILDEINKVLRILVKILNLDHRLDPGDFKDLEEKATKIRSMINKTL